MKRYRVFSLDFDTRAHSLAEAPDHWEENVKKLHCENREKTERGLKDFYGTLAYDFKRQNFVDLGDKPLSILAFHNRFFEQIRVAFVMGAYYPALTAACALGERILNYLLLTLRDDYKGTPEYKDVGRQKSFANWDVPINTLSSWSVLLPEVSDQFRRLKKMRHSAIHFRPEVDQNDRDLAIDSIRSLREIVKGQFSAFGTQPWFLGGTPGESYIKRESENQPFIRKVYLPRCLLVGWRHKVEAVVPRFVVNDNFEYEDRAISDDEFRELRTRQLALPRGV